MTGQEQKKRAWYSERENMLVQLAELWCGWQGAAAVWLQGRTLLEISKVGSECQERVVSLQGAGGLCWSKHRLKEQET